MVSISQISTLEMGFQSLVTPRWPASERTSAPYGHAHQVVPFLRPSVAGAMAVPETSTLLSTSTRGLSSPPPSPVYMAATPSLNHGHWWLRGPATASANWRGVRRNCGTSGTGPPDPARPLRPD